MIRPVTSLISPIPSPIVFDADKRVRINEYTVLVFPEAKPEPTYKELLKDVFIVNAEKKNEKK